MKYLKFLLAAVIITIIMQIIYIVVDGMIAVDLYKDPAYFPVWSKLMMPAEGAPPASFMYLSLLFNFISAVLFTLVYVVLKNGVPGASISFKGLTFGALMFLIAGIPGALAMFLLLNLPLSLILLWTAEDLVWKLLGGMAAAKLNK